MIFSKKLPTVFVDCTHTYESDLNTGIQRTVRCLLDQSEMVSQEFGYRVQAVALKQGRLYPIPISWVVRRPRGFFEKLWRNFVLSLIWQTLDGYTTHQDNILLIPEIYLGNDQVASWLRFRLKGGQIQTIVYDLIPLTHPETLFFENRSFQNWLERVVKHSTQIITISKFTKQAIEKYLASSKAKSKLQVNYFYLGADPHLLTSTKKQLSLSKIFNNQLPVFIVVGSIEPRKNHQYILDAFDLFWQKGGQASLVIIGRAGWKNEKLIERIRHHSKYDINLFLVRDADDQDLDYAYREAAGLIFASIVEGFGLPLIEAWGYGLPVFCSDIPVFREIGAERATFFDLKKPDDLAKKLIGYCRDYPMNKKQHEKFHWLTWAESARQLFSRLVEGKNNSPALAEAGRRELELEQKKLLSASQITWQLPELLIGTDEDFVRQLYLKILGRPADPRGLRNYLKRLRRDKVGRVRIIGAIRYSSEGRRVGVRIKGLKTSLLKLFLVN